MARYAAHAAARCAGGELTGEDCGTGAVSAVAGRFATTRLEGLGNCGAIEKKRRVRIEQSPVT
jgi:hypothetical protein